MALETKLVQKLSQSLYMTPQLQQAIKQLQLGRLEYLEAIQEELLENPVLEEVREQEENAAVSDNGSNSQGEGEQVADNYSSDTNGTPKETEISETESDLTNKAPIALEDYLENFGDSRGSAAPRGQSRDDERPSLEATATREQTLIDYILEQVRLSDIAHEDHEIALHIVGNLDRNGYLCCSFDEVAEACGCSVEEVERIIYVLRSFDPPGICARNLSECLLIQLDNMGLGEHLAARIVRDHIDKLERKRFEQIAKCEHVEVDDVYKAVLVIRSLEPRPGRPFADEATRYIVPDVYIHRVGGNYVVTMNEEGIPKLRVSPYYLEALRNQEEISSEQRTYLTDRLRAASSLIKSIHQRQQTIYRVTKSIAKFQKDFLDHGISRLRPLVLKDVAADIGMHESTVSRVTTNKYVHTPQGVFELKHFFSTGIRTADGDVSSSSVKDRIKQLIGDENPKKPISDQRIVELLAAENIKIARRTVAKYRENLGILSSAKRKKII